MWGGVWHKASVSDCLPLAAPIGLSPMLGRGGGGDSGHSTRDVGGHFPVGECGGLIFTKGTLEKIFDVRENGGNGTVKSEYSVHFSPIFLPFSSTTSRQPSTIFVNHKNEPQHHQTIRQNCRCYATWPWSKSTSRIILALFFEGSIVPFCVSHRRSVCLLRGSFVTIKLKLGPTKIKFKALFTLYLNSHE